ncbi:kinesin-like protein KIF18A [Dinothrombium tinctorium]|uniref:Kinesin-like protein n=1 Tax=Dinothrombium tinctorium TaxID=1965070 RepID=A0A3S3SIP0_9ACAR|nr:kinesin-like protein KIF18A [Dinothrombium tinctorium]
MAENSSPSKRPFSQTLATNGGDELNAEMSNQHSSLPTECKRALLEVGECDDQTKDKAESGTNRIRVFVRVRPQSEKEANTSTVIDIIDKQMLVFDPLIESDDYIYHGKKYKTIGKRGNKNETFYFDRVFDQHSSNMDVYNSITKYFIDSLLDGFNCTVFAYGATGSGKTYTMLGSSEDPGVIFFTSTELFNVIEARKEEQLELTVSYFEVYNEDVYDLLSQPGRKPLTIREDPQRGVMVANLSIHYPRDAEHLIEMLEIGNANRIQQATDANESSSRSHAIFQISLKKQEFSSSQQKCIQMSKMSLIDLAGSERASVAYKENRSKNLQREGERRNRELEEKLILWEAENSKLRRQLKSLPENAIHDQKSSIEILNSCKNNLDQLFKERTDLRNQLMECESNIKKIDLRLILRNLENERVNALTGTVVKDTCSSLYSQKLHYCDLKDSISKKIETNEDTLKNIESDLRSRASSEDMIIDTYFKNQHLITEFNDRTLAEKHALEIVNELSTRFDSNEALIIESMSLNRRMKMMLDGMNYLTESLKEQFSSLQNKVEGKKNVVWRDDVTAKGKLTQYKQIDFKHIFLLPTFKDSQQSLSSDRQSSDQLAIVCSGLTPTSGEKFKTIQAGTVTKSVAASNRVANLYYKTFSVMAMSDNLQKLNEN